MLTVNDFSTFKADLAIEIDRLITEALDLYENILGDGVLDDHPQNLTWMISRLEHMIESLQNRLKEGRWERLYGKPPKPAA
jgi:hypothetical protein